MKNKETIIDSIDVSECMLYKGYCRIAALCDYSGHLCEVTSNCYFKQLARAKEEIKKLKVQIENEKQALQIDIDNLNQACLDLNQENDDLQNKLQAKEQEIEILKTQNIALQTMEFEENKKLKTQLMEKSEVDMFFSTPIEGWDNDPCKICQYKQDYKQKERECETLKSENFTFEELIKTQEDEMDKLKQALDEIEKLKNENQYYINTYCHFKNEIKKYKKAVHKYKVILQDKIKRLYLSRREFLKEINSVSVRIACKGESFKNALNNFNNTIQVINNEDNYKQALDEIEEQIKILQNRTPLFEVEQIAKDIIKIQDIINKTRRL